MPPSRERARWSTTKWIAAILAIAIHLAFVLFLVFSVNWQNRKPEAVTAELYAPPQKTEPTKPAPEPPKPPPEPPKPEPEPPKPPPEPAKPSLSSVLEKDLGLRLQPARASIETIRVVSAQRPSPN